MLITRLDYIEVPLVLKFLFIFLILRPIRYVGMSLSVAAFNNYTNCFCLDMFHTGFQALFNKVFIFILGPLIPTTSCLWCHSLICIIVHQLYSSIIFIPATPLNTIQFHIAEQISDSGVKKSFDFLVLFANFAFDTLI